VNFQFSAICDAYTVHLIPFNFFTPIIPYLFKGANYETFHFARGITNPRHAAMQHLNDTTEKIKSGILVMQFLQLRYVQSVRYDIVMVAWRVKNTRNIP